MGNHFDWLLLSSLWFNFLELYIKRNGMTSSLQWHPIELYQNMLKHVRMRRNASEQVKITVNGDGWGRRSMKLMKKSTSWWPKPSWPNDWIKYLKSRNASLHQTCRRLRVHQPTTLIPFGATHEVLERADHAAV